mgnify:CR=1 FL=1
MKDIQSLPDYRRINIKKVGVKNISYPITVLDKQKTLQHTVATVNMYVNLPHQFKGTHMSRFVEILNRFHGRIDLKSFHIILEEMKDKLKAEEAHMEIEFPYFLKKKDLKSPNTVGISEYKCKMHGALDNRDELSLLVQVPIYPPVVSQVGDRLPRSLGHWGIAEICLQFKHFIWIEDIITMVEEVTSHNLKWPPAAGDSDNLLSVEKITKKLGEKLRSHEDIKWFVVTVKNLSQGLNTFASIQWPEEADTRPTVIC